MKIVDIGKCIDNVDPKGMGRIRVKRYNDMGGQIENAIDYHIGYVSQSIIDQTNILQATMRAMHDCLDSVSGFDHILVDGNYFNPYKDIKHTCVVKGDNTYYSIAAASILAKVSRDEYMEELGKTYPEYGWGSNKGYGSAKHIEAIKTIGITEHHRLSFLKNIHS